MKDKEELQCGNCGQCRRQLDLGVNVYGAQEGVIGPRGFVPLEDMALFCSEECLRDYFGKVDITKLARKIP